MTLARYRSERPSSRLEGLSSALNAHPGAGRPCASRAVLRFSPRDSIVSAIHACHVAMVISRN